MFKGKSNPWKIVCNLEDGTWNVGRGGDQRGTEPGGFHFNVQTAKGALHILQRLRVLSCLALGTADSIARDLSIMAASHSLPSNLAYLPMVSWKSICSDAELYVPTTPSIRKPSQVFIFSWYSTRWPHPSQQEDRRFLQKDGQAFHTAVRSTKQCRELMGTLYSTLRNASKLKQ